MSFHHVKNLNLSLVSCVACKTFQSVWWFMELLFFWKIFSDKELADELSKFYRDFLDGNYNVHSQYLRWQHKNWLIRIIYFLYSQLSENGCSCKQTVLLMNTFFYSSFCHPLKLCICTCTYYIPLSGHSLLSIQGHIWNWKLDFSLVCVVL